MDLFVGTSGYSYKEWKGSFYPEDLPAKAMLSFYGQQFGAVEINNTFYRMPKASVLSAWAAEVPESFTFVLKAPQRITHVKRLKDAEAEVAYFLETAGALGPKLGPILFQLPPNAKKNLERLEGFLATLPRERRFAFEFRHDSWFEEDVYALLRRSGCALCLADVVEDGAGEGDPEAAAAPAPAPEPDLRPLAPFGYLRLRRCDYTEADLERWTSRIRAQPWEQVFVFFKHEDEGTGPRLAKLFRARF